MNTLVNDIGATHWAVLPDNTILLYKVGHHTKLWLDHSEVWTDVHMIPYTLYSFDDVQEAELNSPKYMIGQRVILKGRDGVEEIGTVVKSESGFTSFGAWVFSPSLNHASEYTLSSIRPLPNGQL